MSPAPDCTPSAVVGPGCPCPGPCRKSLAKRVEQNLDLEQEVEAEVEAAVAALEPQLAALPEGLEYGSCAISCCTYKEALQVRWLG